MPIQFYRKPNDKNLYEVGSNRIISAAEFGLTPGGTPGRGFQETKPSIVRDGADILVNAASTGQQGLDQWKNGANLIEAARSVIQMKQGYNKDIQTAKQVWREKSMATGPWEGEQKIFSGMSPEQQASIRAKQYAVAEAHLSGLTDEEKYRAVRTEDTLKYISDIYKEKIQELKDQKADANEKERIKIDQQQLKMQQERNRILNMKDVSESGLPYTYDLEGKLKRDWSSVTTQNIADAIKNVESGGDYKAKGKSGEFGAYQFMPRTWEAWSGAYTKAMTGNPMSLQPTQENQDKVALWKIDQLQKQGYTPDQIASIWNSGSPDYQGKVGTNKQGVKYNVPDYVKKVTANLMTKSSNKDLSYLSSLTDTPIAELQALNLSKDELKLFISIAESNKKGEASRNIETSQHEAVFTNASTLITTEEKKDTSPDIIYALLVQKFSPTLTEAELKSVMTQKGYKFNSLSNRWKKTL